MTELESSEIVYALVCLRTGLVVSALDADAPTPRLVALAEAASQLFGAEKTARWASSFARLGGQQGEESDDCRRMVMVSAGRVHVIERLTHRPDVALAAISLSGEGLGLVLSGVRAKLEKLDVQ